MQGIDKNLLIRQITYDEPSQSAIAEKIFAAASARSLYINNIVFCEVIWTLTKAYKYKKQEMILLIEQILSTKTFVFEDIELLRRCLYLYTCTNTDFSDILIAVINQKSGCDDTLTFDKRASAIPGFTLAE